jgi:hypothetical protein
MRAETCTVKTPPDPAAAARRAALVYRGNLPAAWRVPAGPQELVVYRTAYWGPKDRTLTVQFLDTNDRGLQDRILAHMNAWFDRGACIRFARTAGVGEIRVAREVDGYWSYLGTENLDIPAAEPTMNLENFSLNTPEAEYVRVVRHETGHALGFPHGQQLPEIVARIDEAKALAYFRRTQGWDDATIRSNVLTAIDPADLQEGSTLSAAENVDSLMTYWLPGAVMRDGVPVLGGDDLSVADIATAMDLYPKATPVTVSACAALRQSWASMVARWRR